VGQIGGSGRSKKKGRSFLKQWALSSFGLFGFRCHGLVIISWLVSSLAIFQSQCFCIIIGLASRRVLQGCCDCYYSKDILGWDYFVLPHLQRLESRTAIGLICFYDVLYDVVSALRVYGTSVLVAVVIRVRSPINIFLAAYDGSSLCF
jgi:hypothetical protein